MNILKKRMLPLFLCAATSGILLSRYELRPSLETKNNYKDVAHSCRQYFISQLSKLEIALIEEFDSVFPKDFFNENEGGSALKNKKEILSDYLEDSEEVKMDSFNILSMLWLI